MASRYNNQNNVPAYQQQLSEADYGQQSNSIGAGRTQKSGYGANRSGIGGGSIQVRSNINSGSNQYYN